MKVNDTISNGKATFRIVRSKDNPEGYPSFFLKGELGTTIPKGMFGYTEDDLIEAGYSVLEEANV